MRHAFASASTSSSAELHVIIRRWGWETLVLTPDEKLIARTIINAAREQKPAQALAEIAKAVRHLAE